jgi:4-hydroxybenzoyl-CoA reductase subunit beta
MLRLPPFEYRAPKTVNDALEALASADGNAMFVAGGTDLLPNMKRRQFEPDVLIGLRGIDELRGIQTNGSLRVGAGATLRQIADRPDLPAGCTALQEAAAQVANLQIQRVATLGGNLCVDTRCNYYNQTYEWRKSIGFCLKKDGDICLVAPGSSKCWAVSSSDTAPALIALGAEVELAGPEGTRRIRVADLYQDDGIEYLTRRPDEILTAVHVAGHPDRRSTYVKVRRRGSFDFPILGVGAALRLDEEGLVRDARVVLGAVHTHPLVITEASELMEGERPGAELFEAAAALAQKRSTPLDNTDLTLYWRKRVTAVQVRRALERLAAPAAG